MQMPVQIKHEHNPDPHQGQRYGFDQVNCSAGQPSSIKPQPAEPQQQTIQDKRKHPCDLCPSTFSQLCSLNRHKMAKHSGIQYNCDQCDYVGTTALNTKLHKRSKHEGVRYPCDICGYQATQS